MVGMLNDRMHLNHDPRGGPSEDWNPVAKVPIYGM